MIAGIKIVGLESADYERLCRCLSGTKFDAAKLISK
jgi:hypothetical protein